MNRQIRKKKSQQSLLIWSSIIIFFIIMILFNDLGLIRMYELKAQRDVIHADIKKLKLEISEKKQKKDLLKNDNDYIEKFARQNFRMVKKGEKVYRVRDERSVR